MKKPVQLGNLLSKIWFGHHPGSAAYRQESEFGWRKFPNQSVLDARTTLDLAASYTFCNGVGVYVHVKNLTDAPWRIYEGTRNRVIQQEYYDFTYEAGMKFKF
ncbi:MAG TPA: hypothetical protein VFO40_20855 [Chthoniobacterales bacterium]|nr:hypothetical protein [Chthoniobacterales bacterium]